MCNCGKSQGRTAALSDDLDDGDLDLSASLWFQTLDKILNAKGAACRGDHTAPSSLGGAGGRAGAGGRGRGRGRVARAGAGAAAAARELPQTAAVMGGVLDALLQRTLSSMAGEHARGFAVFGDLGSLCVCACFFFSGWSVLACCMWCFGHYLVGYPINHGESVWRGNARVTTTVAAGMVTFL